MIPKIVFGSLMLVLVAGAAQAQNVEQVRKLYQSATAHYDLGEYKDALADYKEAFRLKQDPAFLYNIGQCYRQLNEPADAERAYRAYLRESPDARNRADVERFIAEMEKAQAEKRASQPPTGVVPPQKATTTGGERAPTVTAPPENPPATAEKAPPAAPEAVAWYKDPLGMALLVGGVVALGVGGGLLGWGASLAGQADSTSDLQMRDDLRNQSGHAYIAGGVVAGVGVLAVAASVVELAVLRPRRAAAASSTVSLHLGGGPGGAFAVVGGSF